MRARGASAPRALCHAGGVLRVLLLTALLAVAGCAGTAGAGPALRGDWELVSGLPHPPGVTATLVVEDAQLTGISFCNHYSSTYRLDGDALTVDGLGVTDMGCAPGVMAAETAFL